MAITATQVNKEVPGASQMISGTVTFDASYVTNGMPVTPTILGYTGAATVVWMAVSGVRGVAGTVCSSVRFDATNQKLLVFNTTAGAETANATNLAALVCDYVAFCR